MRLLVKGPDRSNQVSPGSGHLEQIQLAFLKLFLGVFKREVEARFAFRRHLVHGIGEDVFTNASQATGAQLVFNGFFNHEIEHILFNGEVDALQLDRKSTRLNSSHT